jgi:ATP-dependent Zn protease
MSRHSTLAASARPLAEVLIDALRSSSNMSRVRRRVACHEAGHAIAFLALGIAKPKALSIGGAGGLTESDHGEMQPETRTHLEKFLAAILGGRAAEQIIFGEVTAGAGGVGGSDLNRVTRLAMRLETDYGFGSLGLLCLAGDLTGHGLLIFDHLRTAVGSTIDRAYATALDVLAQNRRALYALADALFSAGYLDRAEIEGILAQTPLRSKPTNDVSAQEHPEDITHDKTAVDAAGTPPCISSNIVSP